MVGPRSGNDGLGPAEQPHEGGVVRRVDGDDFRRSCPRRDLGDRGPRRLEPRRVAARKRVPHLLLLPSLVVGRVALREVLRDELAREARGAEDDEVEVAGRGGRGGGHFLDEVFGRRQRTKNRI